ncbi:MAG: 6-phosphofructokinase, partial [Alistipes sp.]|nr:6-phosphofructokinase [Alistipes sp.]
VTNKIIDLTSSSVSNIIQKGGTMLKTARSKEFRTPEGRQMAYDNMKAAGIDALVVIGGDGSLSGAQIFANEFDVPIVGLPGTIDNDVDGTDETIGYDTALNTIIEAVDKLRDTASSHDRLFFVEVMGNTAGYLSLNGAIASGAEAAIIPEREMEVDQLAELIHNGFRKSKSSAIGLVAENKATGGAMGMAERIKKEFPEFDARVTILGHLQRGGSPTAKDRILASKMGATAIEALSEGQRNVMIGIKNGDYVYVPFKRAIAHSQQMDLKDVDLVRILSM